MAKMFYSLEEAAEKLGKSQDDVRELVSSGQLQEFRDRDRLMFKREQVDLLAGHDSVGGIPLADSKGGSGLTLSLEDSSGGGSGEIALDDAGSKEKSGISIFDTESTEEGDANAVTRITNAATAPELSLESVGSGSGLLDLTREGDDTSLGADLLEDVYKGDEEGGTGDTQGSSGLFEPTSAASDVSAAAGAGAGAMVGMVAAEPYDGAGSGLAGGAALAAAILCGFSLIATVIGLTESGKNVIADLVASNFMMWVGIFAGVVVLCTLLGWLMGKRTTA
ncbi:MAG: helix-turn-helix domain-containing protein [Phycisphaerales bacterium]|nr:helix-turn-helix domain-containing protein [Phycisphaerales bacterium]